MSVLLNDITGFEMNNLVAGKRLLHVVGSNAALGLNHSGGACFLSNEVTQTLGWPLVCRSSTLRHPFFVHPFISLSRGVGQCCLSVSDWDACTFTGSRRAYEGSAKVACSFQTGILYGDVRELSFALARMSRSGLERRAWGDVVRSTLLLGNRVQVDQHGVVKV